MRITGFIAVHRGGTLTKEKHRLLMKWARICAEHVLPLLGSNIDRRLVYALKTASEWEAGKTPTGAAMKASLGAHAAARTYTDSAKTAVARAIGQAVATAHMAEHSLGSALYALKAVALSGGSVKKEGKWQCGQIPAGLKILVKRALSEKGKHFRLPKNPL